MENTTSILPCICQGSDDSSKELFCYLYVSKDNTQNGVETKLISGTLCQYLSFLHLLLSPQWPTLGQKCPTLSPVSLSPWPRISFLHFCCSPYFFLATSNQTARSKTNISSPKKPFKILSLTLPYDFLLHLHINNNYLYVSVTSILF